MTPSILRFSYDAAGSVAAVDFNGTYHYYIRNGQGDVVKLIDGSGTTVVEYSYDSWGKLLGCTGTLATTLGVQIHPLIYQMLQLMALILVQIYRKRMMLRRKYSIWLYQIKN